MSTKIISARFNKSSSYRISSYIADGGYTALVKALKLAPDEIIELVKRARLNGRGGAGFPTGVKWSFVPRSSGRPVFLCVNADEGEPGTFKDRAIMERDPHALVEGAAIAARAIGAEAGFIYVRGEYGKAIERLRKAIDEARSKGFLGRNIKGSGFSFDLHVHAGAGAYVCGEETALIESLEGKRGMPRLRPPFPAQSGFLGCPTVVNNVETLANLPHIISRGPEWFASLGTEKHGGTKLFAVSGHVMKPGLYEFPLGTRFVEILNSAGGTRRGRKLKAFFPGGVSTPLLGADRIHVNMDFDSLAKEGSALGSGAVIVLDDTACIARVAARLARFYAHESCGQCNPCRVGTKEAVAILEALCRGEAAIEHLGSLRRVLAAMRASSLCGLGQAAPAPLLSALDLFEEEFEMHTRKKCAAGVCFGARKKRQR